MDHKGRWGMRQICTRSCRGQGFKVCFTVHIACAGWLQEGSVRSTVAGDSLCPVYKHLPPPINEGRTVSHWRCWEAWGKAEE